MTALLDSKVYDRRQCAVFYRTAEALGGLSNMAAGYPLRVAGVTILTSEALYQACRYPHRPDIQADILVQASPMAAKMKSKRHSGVSRPDWNSARFPIMAWCLRVKLAQHCDTFGNLLLATGRRPIVEASYKDRLWGAVAVGPERLEGANVLGCFLTALRDRLRGPDARSLRVVPPPGLTDFRLLENEIDTLSVEGAQWSLGL